MNNQDSKKELKKKIQELQEELKMIKAELHELKIAALINNLKFSDRR